MLRGGWGGASSIKPGIQWCSIVVSTDCLGQFRVLPAPEQRRASEYQCHHLEYQLEMEKV